MGRTARLSKRNSTCNIMILESWRSVGLIMTLMGLFTLPLRADTAAPWGIAHHSADVSDAFRVSRDPPPDGKPRPEDWTTNRKSWGYSRDTLWLSGQFYNPTDQTQERVLALPFSSPTQADFSVYDADGQLLKKLEAGTFSPWEGRELKLNLIGIRLSLPPHEVRRVVIQQHSNSILDTHYILRLVEDHQKLEWIYLAAYGLYFGLVLALFFHNLSLYFSVRDPVYLAYLVFVICMSCTMLFSSAFYAVFWYRTPTWLHNLPYATPAFSNIGAATFFCWFLHLRLKESWLARSLWLISGLSLITALGILVDPHMFMPWNPFLNTATVLLGMAGSIVKIMNKERYAWFLFIALMCPVLSVSTYYIGNFVLKMMVPSDIMSIAFGLEMILMSVGLSHRVYALRQRQYQWVAQQESIIYRYKMRALNEMASGMAHEINNPLMIISGYAEVIGRLLNREPPNITRIRDIAKRIISNVERIAFIVNSLRSFARVDTRLEMEKVSLQETLRQALALYETRIKDSGIQLKLEMKGGPFMVFGHSSQLIQVISTLFDNSIKALQHAPEKILEVHLITVTQDEKYTVILIVQDSGPGIPMEVQSKIFQPFFTTRPVGEGAGLSLSRAQGIIQSFNGQLYFDSQAHGTRFIIELPMAELAL